MCITELLDPSSSDDDPKRRPAARVANCLHELTPNSAGAPLKLTEALVGRRGARVQLSLSLSLSLSQLGYAASQYVHSGSDILSIRTSTKALSKIFAAAYT